MATINLKKLDGSTAALERGTIDSALGGKVVYPGSAQYDDLRVIWNAMIDRRPAAIACPASGEDVVRAVNFAREHNLAIAAKGGGHNIAGNALLDGGLVVDFQQMKSVQVDAERRTARVQPGATLGDVDRATQRHGLVVPMGVNSTTGIAGLTLGGGFGWMTRKFGLTIDSLRSARLVDASGKLLKVDRNEHPDLFWAIRGGGGNFGIVTEFEFDLHAAGPTVLTGLVAHPFNDFFSVVKEYQRALDAAPDELTCWVVSRKAPPLPFLPEQWHGKEVAILAMCYVGPIEEGEAATAALRRIGKPIAEAVGPAPFVDWQTAFDPLLTPGARNYWKSHDVAAFTDASLALVASAIGNLPTDECEIFFGHVGGAATRVAPDATPWPNRKAHFAVNVHTRWRDPKDDDRCREWARRLHRDLEPHAMGSVYVNFMPEGDEHRVAEAYGTNYDRLARIKKQVDPTNLFRGNQNIGPGASRPV
jgi:FAD/FMN-containing dehydrogenase